MPQTLSIIEIIVLLVVVVLIVLSLIYLWHLHKRRKRPEVIKLAYEDAKSLAYDLLKNRYRGHRGYYKSYQKEFSFDLSVGTLKKALQPNNPTPNPRYVQRVLDDLEPSSYKVLSHMDQDKNQMS